MLLNIPVYHTVEAREKGHRTFYNHSVYKVDEFDVPFVPTADAPVALVYPDRKEGFDIEVRYHDGRFWHPEMQAERPLDPEEWAQMLPRVDRDKKDTSGNPRGWSLLSESRKSYVRSVEFSDDQYRDVKKSDYEEKRASLAAFFDDNVRIIEGGVWFAVEEPRYFRKIASRKVTGDIVFGMSKAKKSQWSDETVEVLGEYFRIDRSDDMYAHDNENFEGMDIDLPQEARILIPGIYEFRDEEISLRSMGRKLCDEMVLHLGDMEARCGKAWFDFRDALRDTRKNNDADAYERLAGTLSVFIEALEAVEPEEGKAAPSWSRFALATGRAMLTRWQVRPMDFSQDFAF